jgi:hypothetical protein
VKIPSTIEPPQAAYDAKRNQWMAELIVSPIGGVPALLRSVRKAKSRYSVFAFVREQAAINWVGLMMLTGRIPRRPSPWSRLPNESFSRYTKVSMMYFQ